MQIVEPTVLRSIVEALSNRHQPEPLLKAIEAICNVHFRTKLFTVLANRPNSREIERLYSSDLVNFPLGGRKPMGATIWGQQVLERGEVWIGDADDIKATFPDWSTIYAVGGYASISIPIRWKGDTIGVMSLAGEHGCYDNAAGKALEVLAAFLPIALVDP